jgi:predicted metal-dependent phosphoesterase TrpH
MRRAGYVSRRMPSIRWCHRSGARAGEWPLDGVESFNASSWIAASNRHADAFGAALGLARCGGSDSHSLATVGRGYTLFSGTSADDLYRAIAGGQTAPGGVRWRFEDYFEIAAYRAQGRWQRWRGRVTPPVEAPVLAEVPSQLVWE